MRIFVTGSTGFIGSAVVGELRQAGHQVLGLTRSEAGAAALRAAAAEPHYGSIEDLESLRRGAAAADGVIHLAFNHDFSKFAENCESDRRVIEALAGALEGTEKPMLITSGTGMASSVPGQLAKEDNPPVPASRIPRAASEEAARAAISRGVAVSVVRLPQVHDTTKAGLISYVARAAREKGASAYVGDGQVRWPAVHLSDAARLYRLALERRMGGINYHCVGEEGVSMKAIAEVVGRGLNLPVVSVPQDKAGEQFGWLAMFMSHDMSASSALTQQWLGWKPAGPGLLADLERTDFSKV